MWEDTQVSVDETLRLQRGGLLSLVVREGRAVVVMVMGGLQTQEGIMCKLCINSRQLL